MKKFFLIVVFLICGLSLSAQDIITKTDGTDIKAKVTEVGQDQISYKKFSNPEGPTYTLGLSDVLMITYENGEREMYNTKKGPESALPQGVMTYNSWSGKISVGGVTMEDELLSRYFSSEDYDLYKSGKSLSTAGTIIGCIGAFPFGWCIGELIVGVKPNTYVFTSSGIVLVGGLIMELIGDSKRRTAMNNYNSSLAFQPQIHFGATDNGVGLAIVF